MTTTTEPDSCSICGYYLTTANEFAGHRCVEPSHWQAAGLLSSSDYYRMAEIAAWISEELSQRSPNGKTPDSTE